MIGRTSFVISKRGEYPELTRTETVRGIVCDNCKQIVPEMYTESVPSRFYSNNDGRDGNYVFCKNVYGLAGTGLVHKDCRK